MTRSTRWITIGVFMIGVALTALDQMTTGEAIVGIIISMALVQKNRRTW